MDGSSTSTADVSAIWAALQAAEDGHARPAEAAAKSYAVAGFTDDAADEEEEDDEDDDVEDDEMAPVMPQRLGGGGLLPSSLYSATGSGGGLLADVVPAFLLPNHRSPYAPAALVSATTTTATATSSSEMFLDDILHAHDDAFAGGGGEAPRLTAERLSQLEDNYERKKKRAKINRRDLNSRFQELMDLLHLKEDRKLNRAKVLEKAIEQITKLTEELRTTRQQLQRCSTSTSTSGGMQPPPAFHAQAPGALPLQMPLPMPQWSSGAAPLMWMPLLPSVRPTARPASARARSSGPKAAKTTTPMTTSVSIQTQTSPEKRKPRSAATTVARPGRKRGRETGDLVRVALEVPTLLEFCDAWTLRAIMGVSQELHAASRRDTLWQRLCHHRWRRHGTLSFERNQRMLWKQLDAANEMPHVGDGSVPTLAFASGRRESVGLWASLVRRSNGRTTRTVLVEGRPVVRQVVELHLLVQNLDASRPLQLSNEIQIVVVGSGCEANAFEILTGDHLAPHLVAVNGISPNNANVGKVGNFQLFHGDVGVVSVFVACDGLDLEHQFLDRVDAVEMQCLWRTRDRTESIWVAAHTQKPAGLAEASVHKV